MRLGTYIVGSHFATFLVNEKLFLRSAPCGADSQTVNPSERLFTRIER